MRNITFNKELFFTDNRELISILAEEATHVVNILYKPSKIFNTGEAIKLSLAEQQKDLLLNASTKQ